MIRVFVGENSFEVQQALQEVARSFNGEVEKVDGEYLTVAEFTDLIAGGTLFSDSRVIIIRNLSLNKGLWNDLPELLSRVSEDNEIILVEDTVDKRTKTYKILEKNCSVKWFEEWTDRDYSSAEAWVKNQAKKQNVAIDSALARFLVQYVGLNQWSLHQALEKLSFVDGITEEKIKDIIEPNPKENVFNLFDAALYGDKNKISQMIRVLRKDQDPYKLFGLISSQYFQMLALAQGEKPSTVSKDFGIHPFVASKLSERASKINPGVLKQMSQALVTADDFMKTGSSDTWLIIENALIKIADADRP